MLISQVKMINMRRFASNSKHAKVSLQYYEEEKSTFRFGE
jgi:hypothetical protein